MEGKTSAVRRLPSAVRMEKGGYLGGVFTLCAVRSRMYEGIYEMIGAAPLLLVSRAASSSIVVASRLSSFSSHQPREFLPLVRRAFIRFI